MQTLMREREREREREIGGWIERQGEIEKEREIQKFTHSWKKRSERGDKIVK